MKIYEKYQIPQDRPTVLYVGRVDPEKQVGVLISAFCKVVEKIPEAILVVVGDGVDKARLEKMTDGLGIKQSVKFLGKVLPPDLYELYKMGDVFATASEIETQGIVLIEAAACGLPLVAVNAGAVAEVCHNNENGFLIQKDDFENVEIEVEMSEALVKILRDKKLRQNFSVKSLEIAKEHDFEKTLDKFINVYHKVTKQYSKS